MIVSSLRAMGQGSGAQLTIGAAYALGKQAGFFQDTVLYLVLRKFNYDMS